MHSPRRCPVCGTIHNILNFEYADEKTMFKCAHCDTEFPMKMMPAAPSTLSKTSTVSEKDVRQVIDGLDNPEAFWKEMSADHIFKKR